MPARREALRTIVLTPLGSSGRIGACAVTKQLVARLDYRFISKASGKQPSELGQVAGS